LRGMAKLLLCFRLLVNMVAQEFWRPPALRLSQTTVYPHIVHLMFSFKNSFRHFKNICSPWPLPLRPSTLQARSATMTPVSTTIHRIPRPIASLAPAMSSPPPALSMVVDIHVLFDWEPEGDEKSAFAGLPRKGCELWGSGRVLVLILTLR
jgi:hypothetical protein